MICTIISHNWHDELMYWVQEFTGIDNPKFFQVPEYLIEEIRTCTYDKVQDVISKIKSICPELWNTQTL